MPGTRLTRTSRPPTAPPVSLGLLREYREELFTLGVTPAHARILLYLQRHPNSYILQCARAFGLTGRTVGYPVRMLQQKHLVTKRRAPHDDRYVMLTLTQRGQTLARMILRQLNGHVFPLREKAS
jgi:DNA-binding MarR family transcriptional regulator